MHMKQGKYFLIVLVLFTYISMPSCTVNDTNDEPEEESIDSSYEDTTVRLFESPDSNFEVLGVDSNLLWSVDINNKTLKKPTSRMTPVLGTVINSLNAQYPEIQLVNPVMGHDTLIMKIPNSDYLTNQIGSSGAAQYLAQAIINLTSVPGVKYVKLNFEMGSHASPGVWDRSDFTGYIIVK